MSPQFWRCMPALVRDVIPLERTVAWSDATAKPSHGPAIQPPALQNDAQFQLLFGHSRPHVPNFFGRLQLVSASPTREPAGEDLQFAAQTAENNRLQCLPLRFCLIAVWPRLLRAEQSFASSSVKRT